MTCYLSASTPAKVNLFLKVTGCRADGFHELETLFYPLPSLYDTLTVELGGSGINLSCANASVPLDRRNLVWRAAELYADVAGVNAEWSITLQKRIPVSAGLGGGSSDAAALLRLLNSHYKRLSFAELSELALKLGADVPYFLAPSLALARGIGEELTLLPEPAFRVPMVLLNPLFPVSAKWAYQNMEKSRVGVSSGEVQCLLSRLEAGDFAGVSGHMHNDLEYALLEKFPLLGIIGDEMLRYGALRPMISGSGSTIFSVCRSAVDAEKVGSALRERFPAFPVFTVT